ncbi:unnamed protein product, partial [Callosobruchus maculatus]
MSCADLEPPLYLLPIETILTNKETVWNLLQIDTENDKSASKKSTVLPGASHISRKPREIDLQNAMNGVILKALPNENNIISAPSN